MDRPRCFTLNREETLRLTSYGSVEIKKEYLTPELKKNQLDSLIDIGDIEEEEEIKPKEVKPKK